MKALLPCPCCTGPAETDWRQGYRALDTGRTGNAAAIYCTKCSVQVSFCYADAPERSEEDIQEYVREMWNTRPEPDKWQQIRESLDRSDALNARIRELEGSLRLANLDMQA
jgi:hypothetical protein